MHGSVLKQCDRLISAVAGKFTIDATYSHKNSYKIAGKFDGKAGVKVAGAELALTSMQLKVEKQPTAPVAVTFKSTGTCKLPILEDPIKIYALNAQYTFGDGWAVSASLSGTPLQTQVLLISCLVMLRAWFLHFLS